MRFLDREGLGSLLARLVAEGYELIGPTVRDGTIVLDRIEAVDDLPAGVGEVEGPGTYRLVRRDDRRVFGFAHGPDAGKRFLFPSSEVLGTIGRRNGHLTAPPAEAGAEGRRAFVGLRPCDLHAIEVQDRVFRGGPEPDAAYAARRDGAFVIGVNCTAPGGTCFCDSMGTGPVCTVGFDVALTELDHGFLATAGTARGGDLLEEAGSREATPGEAAEGHRLLAHARVHMGRSLDTSDLPGLLYRNRRHPRWADVAERCLACGNCTSVCPTCFCHDVVDDVDLAGETATRVREWASCFSVEFSHTAGMEVRTSREARYRQWLTHKFASWIDQFGTSGCVGCGRCITWCPVGIDVTEEVAAIRADDGTVASEVGA